MVINNERINLSVGDILVLSLDNIKSLRQVDILRYNIEKCGRSLKDYLRIRLSEEILISIVDKVEKMIRENESSKLYTKTDIRMYRKLCDKIRQRMLVWN
jgi:hypothetical protein